MYATMELTVYVASAMLEVEVMEIALKILLIVFAIGLIGAVLLQKGKSAGLSGAITGGAEHLFGKQKARGLDLFLERLTVGLAAGFFILALVVSYFVNQ
ncbi:preprotein translocase subunit SecG [Paenibacillus montaniterrae]|uniref:Protein-export membrane protein SecG n=2 Tax=Paenibacillus montaniterrae TaxID=429341 RepID=A0A920CYE1_9BACL|nr:preprotein translocase subunit SecG [Paenibacillus montaniterrae]